MVTHAQLYQEVFSYRFIPETMSVLDSQIRNLRRKLDSPNEAPMILNFRGEGLVLSPLEGAA